ncbi:phenylalanine--tRNA ligase subunit beta [uncultured Desulfuromonas sp.]|uniref:phenylalanine--tRNA ligase subunit beta n=1 Tax=uncultured Desulfuromonas sp. TaxID=181013 RepID=UPI002AABACF3|nr:phenylalanine--tRNA ligase subunit beta [uncultured Desulfuromonas sp.]
MNVTYKWLKEFVDFDLDGDQLSHQLTMAGLEVDYMEHLGAGLDSVIVAQLDQVEAHPDADKLTMCQVNTGTEVIPVVCGAKNHKQGDLIALAQVGTVLPGDFKIKKSKIRGAVSQGMLCSEKELGLAEESEGILILPQGLTLGTPVFDALGLKDIRYEIGLTPNRADCLSVAGVAREVAAMVGKSMTLPEVAPVEEAEEKIETLTSVTIEDADGCPRYMARLIQGVKIGPSPEWLVRRLESVGQRSINNVVDVTNYLLMELGHPLHAFDFGSLRGQRIIVKRAAEGESFVTLDGQTRALQSNDMVICDAEGSVALAGVMGGENSEVEDDTVDVLLESAYFDPISIRRTSKRLGIHSEASHRFERGADIDTVPVALERATALIQQLAGGQVAKGAIDTCPEALEKRSVAITVNKTNRLLGLDLSLPQIDALLRSIELETTPLDGGDEGLQVAIPMSRHDLEREVDLIEEVARLNGYDNIPVTMPASRVVHRRKETQQSFVTQLRNAMVAQGAREIINYSFVSPASWDKIQLEQDDPRRTNVRILNPLTEEQSVMRTSLVPSMLEVVSRNLAYRSDDLRLFELRPVFNVVADQDQPCEVVNLCAILTGRREVEGWSQQDGAVDFFDLKGLVEVVGQQLNLSSLQVEADACQSYLHPGKSCRLYSGKKRIGVMGEVHPVVQDAYDINQPVFLVELDVPAMIAGRAQATCFQQISRFPDVYRDSAILIGDEVSADQVLKVIGSVKVKNLDDVVLFDLYSGKGIPEGKKSLAFRVRYRSTEKTLTDDEINKMHAKIVKSLEKNLGAEIR